MGERRILGRGHRQPQRNLCQPATGRIGGASQRRRNSDGQVPPGVPPDPRALTPTASQQSTENRHGRQTGHRQRSAPPRWPPLRPSDESDCGTNPFVWAQPDQVEQQRVVEPLVLRLTADNRRRDSTLTAGWTRCTTSVGYGVLDDWSDVATPTAELTHRARQRRRWLVSRSGYIWLRRHAQMATMRRSDATTLPSGSSMRTGPCAITGPLGHVSDGSRLGIPVHTQLRRHGSCEWRNPMILRRCHHTSMNVSRCSTVSPPTPASEFPRRGFSGYAPCWC